MERDVWETSVNLTVRGKTVPSFALPVTACLEAICEAKNTNLKITHPHPDAHDLVSLKLTMYQEMTV